MVRLVHKDNNDILSPVGSIQEAVEEARETEKDSQGNLNENAVLLGATCKDSVANKISPYKLLFGLIKNVQSNAIFHQIVDV